MEQSIVPMIDSLEGLFDRFNEDLFGGKLERPVITVAPSKRMAMGWCTVKRAWTAEKHPEREELTGLDDEAIQDRLQKYEDSGYYEINICPEYLKEDVYTVCEVLIHEMCHLLNIMNDIKDCSRNGTYHNKKFKETAEAHGLEVRKTGKYGYAETSLADETKRYIDSLGIESMQLCRKSDLHNTGSRGGRDGEDEGEEDKRKQSSRKLVCPVCGAIARVTKAGIRLGCLTCNAEMKPA